jgi:two-component system sensor kinase FixL
MEGVPHGLLAVSVARGEGVVEVRVTDNGKGLPAALGERIFDAFVSTKTSGLGMGLAISRTIVNQHHGRLEAAPNPGGGTTFRFTLPIDRV